MTIGVDELRRAVRRAGARLAALLAATALLAAASLAISCVDTRGPRMEAWHGHPIEELIEHWGAPVGIVTLKDGRKVYTWLAVYGSGRTYRSSFTTSKDGIIESSSYHDASVPGRPE